MSLFEGGNLKKGEDSCRVCPQYMVLALCVDIGVCCVLLDELSAWLHIVAHQHRENLVSLSCILDGNLLEQACCWVHSGFPKLLWVHLTQTFVSLGVDILIFCALAILVDESLALLFCIAILAHLAAVSTLVERWGSDVQVTFLNNFWHEAIEECHDQRVDVGTIDVGIGHDDNLVVTQLVCVGFLAVLTIYTEANSDTLDDVHNRLCFEDFMPLNLLYVQNLTTQWEDSLAETVAALLGRTTSGITLDEENLAFLRILHRAIGKLTRKTATSHEVLALYAFACLACSDTCCSSQDNFFADALSLVWMFLQVIR